MPADDQLESLAHGSQLGIVQPVLGERRSVARGEQELVALTKRKAELLGDAQQQVAPRLGAAGLHEAEMARRDPCVERELELRQPAPRAPLAQPRADTHRCARCGHPRPLYPRACPPSITST